MHSNTINLRKGISLGVLSGMIWGIAVLMFASATKVFEFDFGLLQDFPVFLTGGAGFGLVLGAFMEVLRDKLPFNGIIQNAIALSVSIWLLFFAGGVFLHLAAPARYHFEGEQAIQGFFLSFVLGLILGILWKQSSQN
ncbi:MAG: hypothetical protein HZA01_08570 [Nitrospinae bacterium]|nr:hypothetical protein [Nitrospinota bacterium]